MRYAVLALAALYSLAALPRGAAAQEENPDLTGSWKLQQRDSLPSETRRAPAIAGDDVRDLGLPSGSGLRRVPGDTLGGGPVRTLTITQTDSTVTIAGERFPLHTYFTDGREESFAFRGVETVVRAWWEWGDLVIERKGGERTTVESYRLDEKGPWLIVIVEIRPDGESDAARRTIRLHRIYDREAEPPAR